MLTTASLLQHCGGGDQDGDKAVAEIRIKSGGVESGGHIRIKKGVGSEYTEGVESKGNVVTRKVVGLDGRNGFKLRVVESEGQTKESERE